MSRFTDLFLPKEDTAPKNVVKNSEPAEKAPSTVGVNKDEQSVSVKEKIDTYSSFKSYKSKK